MPGKQLFGFNSTDAAKIKRSLVQGQRSNTREGQLKYPQALSSNLRAYVLEPKETIEGITRSEVGEVTIHSGSCFLIRRNHTTNKLEYQTDISGAKVSRDAWNLCTEDIKSDAIADSGSGAGSGAFASKCEDLLFATEDQWGDLYIVERCQIPCDESSSGGSSSSGAGGFLAGGPVDIDETGNLTQTIYRISINPYGRLSMVQVDTVEFDICDICDGSEGSGLPA